MGDMKINPDDARSAEFYDSEWVEEAVFRYLNDKSK